MFETNSFLSKLLKCAILIIIFTIPLYFSDILCVIQVDGSSLNELESMTEKVQQVKNKTVENATVELTDEEIERRIKIAMLCISLAGAIYIIFKNSFR